MKRFITTILAVMMLLELTACGNKIHTGMSGDAVIDNDLLGPNVPDNEFSESEVPDNEHWEPDEVVLPEGSIGDLSNISSFEKSAYMTSNIGTCVATDGTYMYVADGLIRKYGSDGLVVDTFKDPAFKIACVNGKLIYSTSLSIRVMNLDGTGAKEITNANASAEFCCQNGRIFFFQKIPGLMGPDFLCSVNMDGSDFVTYEQKGTRFVYADSKRILVSYVDNDNGIYVRNYDLEENHGYKVFSMDESMASICEVTLEQLAANGENFFYTTSSNSYRSIYRMTMLGGSAKRINYNGFQQIRCCGDRLYLSNRDWVECYDLNTRELYDCQDTIYAKDAADILLDVFGDYIFLAVNDMESSVRIRKIDRQEYKLPHPRS